MPFQPYVYQQITTFITSQKEQLIDKMSECINTVKRYNTPPLSVYFSGRGLVTGERGGGYIVYWFGRIIIFKKGRHY